ncbi:Dihydroorotate dehydrogenase, electron transfer subunit, iron-sulphur cluster binding domain protein [Thermocrinis albus DSM 14484]|uniref:Dihydroorotate dehydrogenase, electron transfer subunit, iron-sulphur cluster binding domain protein n=1 Tax=Thermocrinis albus (strain DSM 14484 / JCM 11386 / HI 11/12) TaxID=638303 RepID=D3SN16_THEAH|nr:dihydroorotate dehydrogenase [Thermocrinis albus]ADC90146.1 Dihydroorotate dehydrogenase, electron transfer subunit, iron-sulphur cluster binding domain protein [Thermocrinis albus DSM 14484]
MFPILEKSLLREDFLLLKIRAPHLLSAKPGQLVILQPHELSERIPVCILDLWEEGFWCLLQVVGRTTLQIKEEVESFYYVGGPIGKPFPIKNYGKVVFYTTGWGVAPAFNVGRALKKEGCSLQLFYTGPGEPPMYHKLREVFEVIETQETPPPVDADLWVSAGSNELSRYLVSLGKGVPHIALVNTYMLDAVGLCLVCRVTVKGSTQLACVDGPWFPAEEVDWENLLERETLYRQEEELALEEYLKELRRRKNKPAEV